MGGGGRGVVVKLYYLKINKNGKIINRKKKT